MRRVEATTLTATWIITTAAAWWWLASIDSLLTWGSFLPDIGADKYLALEALSVSGDPYQTLTEIAPYEGWPAPAPRPPAAILLMLPLAHIPDAWLLPLATPITIGMGVFALWVSTRIAGVSWWWAVASVPLLVPTGILEQLIISASVTMVYLPLLLGGWLLLDRYPRLAGVLMGGAAAIKIWPALVIVALVRRLRTATWMVATAVAVTGIGLMLEPVTITGTVDSMVAARSFFLNFASNLSFTRFGWVGWMAGSTVAAISVMKQQVGLAILAGLMLSPLSWAYYWLAGVPVLFSLIDRMRSLRCPA